jgi:hypothetical protein
MFLTALDFFIGPAHEIAIVGDPKSEETKNMLHAIRKRFIPNKVMLLKKPEQKNLEDVARFTKDMKMIDNKTTVYICRNFVCDKPITEVEEVLKVIANANNI